MRIAFGKVTRDEHSASWSVSSKKNGGKKEIRAKAIAKKKIMALMATPYPTSVQQCEWKGAFCFEWMVIRTAIEVHQESNPLGTVGKRSSICRNAS